MDNPEFKTKKAMWKEFKTKLNSAKSMADYIALKSYYKQCIEANDKLWESYEESSENAKKAEAYSDILYSCMLAITKKIAELDAKKIHNFVSSR